MKWFSYVFLIGFVLVKSIWPSQLSIDGYVVFLLVVISVPFIAPFAKSFKMLGGQFDFKESIDKVEVYTKKSVKIIHPEATFSEPKAELWPAALNLKKTLEIVEEDPVLALAALRIDLEKALKLLYVSHGARREFPNNVNIRRIISTLQDEEFLHVDQVSALNEIIFVCNKAIHGHEISKSDATKVIELAKELSTSFPIGYVPNFTPNKNWESHGLVCEWEHCIELSPFTDSIEDLSCHLFGHDCPGGAKQQLQCKKNWNSKTA